MSCRIYRTSPQLDFKLDLIFCISGCPQNKATKWTQAVEGHFLLSIFCFPELSSSIERDGRLFPFKCGPIPAKRALAPQAFPTEVFGYTSVLPTKLEKWEPRRKQPPASKPLQDPFLSDRCLITRVGGGAAVKLGTREVKGHRLIRKPPSYQNKIPLLTRHGENKLSLLLGNL